MDNQDKKSIDPNICYASLLDGKRINTKLLEKYAQWVLKKIGIFILNSENFR